MQSIYCEKTKPENRTSKPQVTTHGQHLPTPNIQHRTIKHETPKHKKSTTHTANAEHRKNDSKMQSVKPKQKARIIMNT